MWARLSKGYTTDGMRTISMAISEQCSSCVEKAFWRWIRVEAKRICSDGCSKVPDFYIECCWLHDLCYRLKVDPFRAYALYTQGVAGYWDLAPEIDQRTADKYLRDCIQKRSWFGKWSPMSWWRYGILRKFGSKAWNDED